MSVSSRSSGMAKVAERVDPAGLLYGAIVSGATLGAVSAHADEATRVAVATLLVLGVYWSAHVYIHALSAQLEGGDTRLLFHRTVASAREEASVFVGGLPTVVLYLILTILGVAPTTAGFISLWFLVALLFAVGYLGARWVGLTGFAALVEAAGAGFFGVLIVIMKSLLH